MNYRHPSDLMNIIYIDLSRNPPLHRTVLYGLESNARKCGTPSGTGYTVASLARNDLSEWSLRSRSTGRYIGMVLTRSIAEGVLCSRILRHLRSTSV
jgi:hypothetical protein